MRTLRGMGLGAVQRCQRVRPIAWACLAFLFFVVALSRAETAVPPAVEALLKLPSPLMTVTKTVRPPKVDGKLTPNEWRYATETSGFLNLADGNLADEKTVVHVTFDAAKLYFAFECALTSERMPRATELQRDGGVHADESIEVHLWPPGAPETQYYHLIFNSRGTISDRRGTDKSWDGHWEIANDAGMSYWNAEVAVPLSDLGVTNLSGQTWRVNFARSAGVHTSWAYTGKGYLNPARWGTVRFADATVVGKVYEVSINDQGEAVVKGGFFNNTDEQPRGMAGSRQPAFDPGINKKPGQVGAADFRQEMRPRLLHNELKDFQFTKAAHDERRKLLEISIATEAGPELYHQSIPWQPKPLRYVELLAEPKEQKAFVRLDARALSGGGAIDLRLKAVLRGGAFEREIKLAGFSAKAPVQAITLADWPVGTYDCSFELTPGESAPAPQAKSSKRSAKTLAAPMQGKLVYERLAAPAWQSEGSKLGLTAAVPKPWTPIRWSADAAETWGRKHQLGKEFVLDQIYCGGVELLRRAINLQVDAQGKTTMARLRERKSLRTGEQEGAWETVGTLGPWRANLTTAIEFDGMLRFDLELQADQPAKLEGLRLVVPLRAEYAKYFHNAASYYARGTSGSLPAAGTKLGFWPLVWLGDDQRGLMWFCESEAGWHSNETPIEIHRAGEETRLIIHFVNRPELVAGKKLTFGLQATPVKPLPADWRGWHVESVRPKRLEAKAVNWEGLGLPIQWSMLPPLDGINWQFSAGHTAPFQATEQLHYFVNKTHAKGTRIIPYLYLHGVTDAALGADRYYHLWQTSSPREMAFSGRVIKGACAAGPFADYLLAGIEHWVTKYKVDGVYFDGAGPPVPCANALHGHGWLDAAGNRQPMYPIFDLRDFYKRLWVMLNAHLTNPVVWVHADGKMPIPCFSFVTANYEGEMVQGPLTAGEALLSDLLPPDYWRSHAQATQWGVVPFWLPKLSRDALRPRQQSDTLATLLVHGTVCAKPEIFDREPIEKIWRAQHAFGIGQATFHPYWENAAWVKVRPAGERTLLSFYERAGKYLVVVANLTNQEQSLAAEFLRGPAPGTRFNDVMGGEPVAMDGNSLTVKLPARTFRLLMN